MKEIGATEFRDQTADAIGRAQHARGPDGRTVVTKHGSPVAVVVSLSDLEVLERFERTVAAVEVGDANRCGLCLGDGIVPIARDENRAGGAS